ncbi:glycosyltransferase [Cardiobacterium sp. AH-315-I02]|nr:glycosyltransferase [Cardiobacterium sp. AH-315-I02]
MKVLMLSPHPFYQERGTLIAEKLVIRALTERGYQIDLLTFNEGDDVDYPGLAIHRVKPVPKIENVRPGFSVKKLLLDILLFFKFIDLMIRNRYDVVHASEESAFMALVICPLFKTPYIYDMDSSMVTQILDKATFLRPLQRVLRWLESLPMRHANLVIPVCEALADDVAKYRSTGIHVLKDVSLASTDSEQPAPVIDIHQNYQVKGKMFMYIGNLESYQGIDLMLDAFAIHYPEHIDSRLIIIGGEQEDIEHYQIKCQQLSIQQAVIFMGKQPVTQIGSFMSQADILLSPRTQGVNTPMKVYSYLDSGVVVLATDLPTHTQVADSTTAYLCAVDKKSFAAGMKTLSMDVDLCNELAENAKKLIAREHSYPVFRSKLYEIYDDLPKG